MNEHELQRQAKHRLAILRHVEEVTGNVAAPARLNAPRLRWFADL
jgi:hypothetical protein